MKRLLPIILLLLSSVTLAESGAYWVEVIIFRNLAVETEATGVEELRSFSQFPELAEITPDTGKAGEPVADMESVDFPEPHRGDLPDDLRVVTQKSPQMNDAWRRLRSSNDYRPLIYSAWEQNRTDYYPPLRIHGEQIIDTQLRPPTSIIVADLAAQDPLAAYRSVFYRIDGSIQLRRSRFLHLYLDLEYREPKPQSVRVPGLLSGEEIQIETEADHSFEYGVFALKQNRQIQTGRMQYFDTPYFGVLALITAVAPE